MQGATVKAHTRGEPLPTEDVEATPEEQPGESDEALSVIDVSSCLSLSIKCNQALRSPAAAAAAATAAARQCGWGWQVLSDSCCDVCKCATSPSRRLQARHTRLGKHRCPLSLRLGVVSRVTRQRLPVA